MSKTIQCLFICAQLILGSNLGLNAQKSKIFAPADIVITTTFSFDISQITDPNYFKFGSVVADSHLRKKIITNDKVCQNFCEVNNCTNYSGQSSNHSSEFFAENRACQHYLNLYDSTKAGTLYPLYWGQDGYLENTKTNNIKIEVIDNRKLSQDTKGKYGLITRIFSGEGYNNKIVTDTQRIWIVDCNYSYNFEKSIRCKDSIKITLDNTCSATLNTQDIVIGGPYKCWDNFKLAFIKIPNDTINIDKDSILPGIQFNYLDSGTELYIALKDIETERGCTVLATIEDTNMIRINFPDTITVKTEQFTCLGRLTIPKSQIYKNCNPLLKYNVNTSDGNVLEEIDSIIIINLPEGLTKISIYVLDSINFIKHEKTIVVKVIDLTPPEPMCPIKTTVSINGNQSPGENFVKVYAESFDDWSYDNCQPQVWFKVIRMAELLGTNNGADSNNIIGCSGRNGDDNSILSGNQVYFDDYTYFCCADIGTGVKVVLRVFDIDPGAGAVSPKRMDIMKGRFSDCLIDVQVANKSIPTVVAPPNIVVSCKFWFDITKINDPNDSTFGRVVTNLSARKKVVTQDIVCHKFCERNVRTGYPGYVPTNTLPKSAPNKSCDYYNQFFDTAHWDMKFELEWGSDGYVISACGTAPTITINDLRECGQGQIQRVISTVGPNNLNVSAIQTIWVVDCDPFYVDENTCNDARYTDLFWPNGVCTQTPVMVEGCGGDISPDNSQLGRPTVINNADDNCALISIEFQDKISSIDSDACFKILRTWTVIDWCQYDPFIDPDFGRWEALQVIKVRDKDKPVVTCHVGECEPATYDNKLKTCVGPISLIAEATDNCSPLDWLLWEYKIDAFNDGKGVHGGYDYRVGSLTRKDYTAGDTVEYSHNPFASDRHNPFDASGSYPVGTHKICWFVEDGCGNVGVCCTLFEIKDCKAPTPYCLTGDIVGYIDTTGCIEIQAAFFDEGSFDNCNSKDQLKFSFDSQLYSPSLKICCQDFATKMAHKELTVKLKIWISDEEGNKNFCDEKITIFDNLNICDRISALNENSKEYNFTILPNPFYDQFHLITLCKYETIEVFDITGRMIRIYDLNHANIYEGNNLNQGLYFFQLNFNNKKSIIKRFIKLDK